MFVQNLQKVFEIWEIEMLLFSGVKDMWKEA